ncbi:hypothetical protein CHLRE_05g237890v5 [Chlamydomonas reinhardtii]|uniref:Uncharacterized protein n=1 Tax=Chlamydomonas reinhardtii TaxID=3055 RepID=A0A2K3DSY7_CHLRE|nr:uncharacterized protein CHLRE_05g237890v5 [Chlamydomonas reinhardtii]PNW83641.1 hypothetical protein CHLRE_05g237890v5 [Chlamydomonas reinhardtii]
MAGWCPMMTARKARHRLSAAGWTCTSPSDLDGFSTDNERKPLCAAEVPLGSPADDALKPTASARDTHPAHWRQACWDTAQAFKARAADSLQQALSCRYDATPIGCGLLVQQYIAQTVWQLELQAVSDLQAAGQWEAEWQVRVQAMQQAVRVAEAVAKNGRLEHVLVVPVFVV